MMQTPVVHCKSILAASHQSRGDYPVDLFK
jgi:hypothetical protein